MENKFREDTILVDEKELYPIPNYPGYFADIEEGRVFNTFTEKWLGEGSKGSKRTGYIYITMKDANGKKSPISLHAAIFTAYMGITKDFYLDKGMTLHHISGDKTDNSYFNLIPVLHKHQYNDIETKKRLKSRSTRRLTPSEKDDLETAWESLENPKRSDFVNEWSDKLDVSWRTIDNYVKRYLIDEYIED
ncbi:hypothetical protein AB1283_04125 [Bacillus sp. S13(2024)]|uniref:hypothetical protein n=1 Tax=unclassified Bacillus (in: firmicutes) TaxID=185979 RepID=UPI003D1EF0DE